MSASMAMLVDTTRCTGCEKCVVACKERNGLGEDVPRRWKQRIDDLSSTRYTTILRRPGAKSVRHLCRHCEEPACASACIVGALQKTPEGPVVYDPDRCMGCRYCMNACPYGIPRYDWEDAVPLIRKCDMCRDRQLEGQAPACVEACPHDVTTVGSREDLVRQAHARIEASPDRYVDHVYGETEVGGTSVLYVSDIELDFLGWKPDLDEKPLPDLTWAALSKVPPIVVGMTGLMAGAWWLIGRRNQLQAEAALAEVPAEEESA